MKYPLNWAIFYLSGWRYIFIFWDQNMLSRLPIIKRPKEVTYRFDFLTPTDPERCDAGDPSIDLWEAGDPDLSDPDFWESPDGDLDLDPDLLDCAECDLWEPDLLELALSDRDLLRDGLPVSGIGELDAERCSGLWEPSRSGLPLWFESLPEPELDDILFLPLQNQLNYLKSKYK